MILSDRGLQFTSRVWKETLGCVGIITKHTAVYHPQSNQADQMMRKVGRIFRAYCNQKYNEWALWINKVEDWLNCIMHESTG